MKRRTIQMHNLECGRVWLDLVTFLQSISQWRRSEPINNIVDGGMKNWLRDIGVIKIQWTLQQSWCAHFILCWSFLRVFSAKTTRNVIRRTHVLLDCSLCLCRAHTRTIRMYSAQKMWNLHMRQNILLLKNMKNYQ